MSIRADDCYLYITLGIPWYIKPEPIAARAVPASPYVIHL